MWQKLKNVYHLILAFLAAVFYGFPAKRIRVIGVTGTDGKTTTVCMIYHILKFAGKKVSMISSVNAVIASRTQDTGFHVTTPSAWQIQKTLKDAYKAGSEYFVLEATSHGLDQNRLAFIDFEAAVLTNITLEHLDYHKSWANYVLSKSKLFGEVRYSILNKDDKSFDYLKNRISGKLVSYSISGESDFNLENFPVKLRILGDYNLSNALGAAACTVSLGVDKNAVRSALLGFGGIEGRMQKIDIGQDFDVYIDFAHTPNSLENALKTLRKLRNGRSKLIAVFGCAGERDQVKRKPMGKIAAKLADITIVTAEDPRGENVEDISEEIAVGLRSLKKTKGRDYFVNNDRGEAIDFAFSLAKRSDIVGIFGKGHEKSMCFGNKETPWSDSEYVKQALIKLNNK